MAGRRRFGRIRKLPSDRWQARYCTPDGREHTGPQLIWRVRRDPQKCITAGHRATVVRRWSRKSGCVPADRARSGHVDLGGCAVGTAKRALPRDPSRRPRITDGTTLTRAAKCAKGLARRYGFTYGLRMADVVTTGEARDALHQIAKRFDEGTGEPVYFGSHRRAQGVIVPVDVWEKLLEAAEDDLDLGLARERLLDGSAQRLSRADLDEAFRHAADAARRPA